MMGRETAPEVDLACGSLSDGKMKHSGSVAWTGAAWSIFSIGESEEEVAGRERWVVGGVGCSGAALY